MPGPDQHLVTPVRGGEETEVHSGQNPGLVLDDQVLVAEMHGRSGLISHLLSHVHEGRGLETLG